MLAGNLNFMADVPTAKDGSSITHELKWSDFHCMKYGSMKPNQPFIAKDVTGLGLMASVFAKMTAIPGKTGGEFTFILEKVELL